MGFRTIGERDGKPSNHTLVALSVRQGPDRSPETAAIVEDACYPNPDRWEPRQRQRSREHTRTRYLHHGNRRTDLKQRQRAGLHRTW